jgi:hypothetical protein
MFNTQAEDLIEELSQPYDRDDLVWWEGLACIQLARRPVLTSRHDGTDARAT